MIMIKRDTELACYESTKGVEQTVDYFGLEVKAIQRDNAESRLVLAGDYVHLTSVETSGEDFETKIKYKPTMETGEYIELEVVNQSRDIY